MLGLALAAGGASLSVVLAARAALRVTRLAPPDRTALEESFRKGDDAAVERATTAAFPDAAPAMLAVRGDPALRRAAIAALDEQLGDLDRELSVGRTVGAAAVRVALLAAGLGAVLELAADLSSGRGLVNAISAAGAGVFAAVASVELGRRAAQKAEALRGEWDSVAGAAATRLGLADVTADVAAGLESAAPGQAGVSWQRRARRRGQTGRFGGAS